VIIRGVLAGAAVATSVVAAAPLHGQEASLLLGGIHTAYADSLSGSAGTIGARFKLQTPSFWTQLDGFATRFTTGGWATQGSGGLLGLVGLSRHVALGIRADANVNAIQDGPWSAIGSGGPYLVAATDGWIAAGGVTGGGVRSIDALTSALVTGVLRMSRLAGRWTVDLRASSSWADTIRFFDALAGLMYSDRHLTVSASGGIRTGDLGDDPWAQGRVEWRVTPFLGLEASVGTYPADITGFTEGFFVSAGLRVGTRRRDLPPERDVTLQRLSDEQAEITFVVRDAEEVAIAGEWNAWTPTPLARIDGSHWRITLPLGPGAYRFALVIDGDRWVVPHGIPAMPDDFGGEVGLLLIGGEVR
jgi:hypothetical protein